MDRFTVGDIARVETTVTVDGSPADPDTVTATVQAPDGTTTNPTPTNTGVGVYEAQFPVDQPGRWVIRFEFGPDIVGVDEQTIDVEGSLLARIALCTLADIAASRRDVTGGARDAITYRAIEAATEAIHRHTGRQFTRDQEEGIRRYPVDATDVAIGDLSVAPSLVRLTSQTGGVLRDLTADVIPLPYTRNQTPITRLRLPMDVTADGRYLIEVTGFWGWPAIPADVREACVDVACSWLDLGAAVVDASGERFEPGLPVGRALTLRAKELLRPYRRRMGLT